MYHSGKTYAELSNEYGISHSALAKWIKQYSEVKIDDETVVTAEQIKALQKRNAQLEEENLILKKRLQYSLHTQTKVNGHTIAFFGARNNNPMSCAECQ